MTAGPEISLLSQSRNYRHAYNRLVLFIAIALGTFWIRNGPWLPDQLLDFPEQLAVIDPDSDV
jgi:hypothetical protein